MSLQEWVANVVVKDDGFVVAQSATVISSHGILIERTGMPAVYAYCPDADGAVPFAPKDVNEALAELPGLEFIVVVGRGIANETYAFADSMGVPVGNVGDLKAALRRLDDVSTFVGREDSYVRSRLEGSRWVTSYMRRGPTTYEIQRSGGLRTLIVAMIEPYELTVDHAYQIVNSHRGIDIDAIVSTNPSCRGFSEATLQAVNNAGIIILTFADFLSSVRDEWIS